MRLHTERNREKSVEVVQEKEREDRKKERERAFVLG